MGARSGTKGTNMQLSTGLKVAACGVLGAAGLTLAACAGGPSIEDAADRNFDDADAPIAAEKGRASGRSTEDVVDIFNTIGQNFHTTDKLRALDIALASNRPGGDIDTIYDAVGRDFDFRDKLGVAQEAVTSSWSAGSIASKFDEIGPTVNNDAKLEVVRNTLDGASQLG